MECGSIHKACQGVTSRKHPRGELLVSGARRTRPSIGHGVGQLWMHRPPCIINVGRASRLPSRVSSGSASMRVDDLSYTLVMSRVYSARVRGGVVIPDGVTLPEGTAVTIAVNDEREADIELTPEELAELDDAIVEADRSESVSSNVVLAELDRIAAATKR